MIWILDRRIGGLELRRSAGSIAKMLVAALIMGGVCLAVERLPFYPHRESKLTWLVQLTSLMGVGAVVYLGLCTAMGIPILQHAMPKRFRKELGGRRSEVR
jgi:peptidoglycan biosynthesis protein MviN/MurJ (putative lipid II flippase)